MNWQKIVGLPMYLFGEVPRGENGVPPHQEPAPPLQEVRTWVTTPIAELDPLRITTRFDWNDFSRLNMCEGDVGVRRLRKTGVA